MPADLPPGTLVRTQNRRAVRRLPNSRSRRLQESSLDLFEFILIMTSVIFALAVAQLLSGVSRLAQAAGRVRTYPAHTLWVLILFTSIFLVWWATWEFRGVEWAFPQYGYLLFAPTLLYFGSSLILPQEVEGEVDLEAHFFRIRRPLMWSFFLFTIIVVFDGPFLGTEPVLHPARIAHGTWLLASAWGAVVASRNAHIVIAIVILSTSALLTATRFWSFA